MKLVVAPFSEVIILPQVASRVFFRGAWFVTRSRDHSSFVPEAGGLFLLAPDEGREQRAE